MSTKQETAQELMRAVALMIEKQLKDIDVSKTPLFLVQGEVSRVLQEKGFERDISERLASYIKVDMAGIEMNDHLNESLIMAANSIGTALYKMNKTYRKNVLSENIELYLVNAAKNMGLSF